MPSCLALIYCGPASRGLVATFNRSGVRKAYFIWSPATEAWALSWGLCRQPVAFAPPTMVDDRKECQERQEDEIVAMSSILSDAGSGNGSSFQEVPSSDGQRLVRLRIPIQFPDGARDVVLLPAGFRLSLSHLPPIEAVISLPESYPTRSSPVLVDARASWKEGMLAVPVKQIWRDAGETESLLYISEWLGQDMWSDMGSFTKEGVVQLHFGSAEACRSIRTLLTTYETRTAQEDFEASSYECVICLSSSRGDRCIRLGNCGHTFCSSCLREGLALYAREGDWQAARICPALECGATRKECGPAPLVAPDSLDTSGPDPAEVILRRPKHCSLQLRLSASRSHAHQAGYLTRAEQRFILGPELLARVDRLELETATGQDLYADFCPFCKAVAIADEETELVDDEGRPGFGSLLICTKCRIASCRMCGHSWHGRTRCGLDRGAIADRYSAALAENDDATVVDLERRYTRPYLQHLVDATSASKEDRAWIQNNTKPCPQCRAPVFKSDGCNHIHCLNCGTHFCWRCGNAYYGSNFYEHYSNPTSRCFNQMIDVPADGPGDIFGF